MTRWTALACAVALAAGLHAVAAADTLPTRDTRPAPGFTSAWRKASATTVGVFGIDDPLTRAARIGGDGAPARVGAGFFVDAHGHVATSAHLVAGAQQVLVRLPDDRYAEATLVGVDETTDVAVLSVPGVQIAPVLGSTAPLRPGDWVLTIGEPYGLRRSLSAGIVGGIDRHFREDGEVLFIQSDAALNPGNSGGPLVDADGNIIGMNARTIAGVAGTSGLSLSVPIEIVSQVVRELIARDASPRPRLGATFDDLSAEQAFEAGPAVYGGAVVVTEVARVGIARRMGLRAGDLILQVDDRPIRDSADLVHTLLGWRADEKTHVVVLRDDRLQRLRLDTAMARESQAWRSGSPR
ncbi:MAG: trypsin-like peptidase domain-containing protein [Proteobacteria bacterium]|nr:trypsin-like peptidase domain-containing protein [Pseudomonadota bacterium]